MRRVFLAVFLLSGVLLSAEGLRPINQQEEVLIDKTVFLNSYFANCSENIIFFGAHFVLTFLEGNQGTFIEYKGAPPQHFTWNFLPVYTAGQLCLEIDVEGEKAYLLYLEPETTSFILHLRYGDNANALMGRFQAFPPLK